MFEPLGFAMENFDAVGQWRTQDAGNPIDTKGMITDGTELEGLQSLRDLTVRKGDMFAEVVIENLMTYAMGRGVEFEDMPLVRSITHKAAEDNYKFSSVIMQVVESPAFTMNLKTDTVAMREE